MVSKKPHQLLIVDDDVPLRSGIAQEFRNRGWNVDEASGGFEGHACLEKTNYDLVITNVRMPQGSGVNLLESLRMMTARDPIVILMSPFFEVQEYQAFRLGAATLITKPFEVLEFVKAALETFEDELELRKFPPAS